MTLLKVVRSIAAHMRERQAMLAVEFWLGGRIVWTKILGSLQPAARWVRYAYFLRFSLMLWLFAPVLCVLNLRDSTLTSGIVTPETWQQYVCVGFFLVSASFAALVMARVVIINGPERWDRGYNKQNDARPPLLTRFLDNDSGKDENAALLISQAPTGLVFLYLIINGVSQDVNHWQIWPGFILGAILSAVFWWVLNAWYYVRYVPPPLPQPPKIYSLGENAARTILFPRWCFGLNREGSEYPGEPTIEQAKTDLPRVTLGALGEWLARQPGFGFTIESDHFVFEGHAFATVALLVFILFSVIIWPLTAPVPAPTVSIVMIGSLLFFGAVAIGLILAAKPLEGGSVWKARLALCIGIASFLFAVVKFYMGPSPERFPILATILILVTALSYALAGVAFFLDRYRVPVLTMIVVAMIVPRLFHLDRTIYWDGGPHLGNSQEEHYLSTTTYNGSAAVVQTPAKILADRIVAQDQQPLIIVTATGGGLHASAWTAAILARLEEKIGRPFHHRLLLMSTVSGGSVGLMAYLRELHEGTLESNPDLAKARMQSAAQCSSLEGVGWGLIYYDLPKAFVPIAPYFIPPSSGDGDLEANRPGSTPLLKDRTWSLRKAFERNLNNSYCNWLWVKDGNPDPGLQTGLTKNPHVGAGLTLRQLPPVGLKNASFPAFTMNTTTVEHGERFLLANYAVPEHQISGEPEYRARSFLATFSGTQPPVINKQPPLPDLPLATAAQMSATFPYVSSAARVPMAIDNNVNSVHFVDGGYYDNDGTASAIEFLRYALAPSPQEKQEPGYPQPDPIARLDKDHPLRILLIEIRNSGDIAPTGPETNGDESNDNAPWNALSQLEGPLLGFWQAGHESVTGRNRTALGLLEQALDGKLQIHRVVFADANSPKLAGTDPLNWSLTPKQRGEVRFSAKALPLQEAEARCWFTTWDEMWKNAQQPNPKPIDPDKCVGAASPNPDGRPSLSR